MGSSPSAGRGHEGHVLTDRRTEKKAGTASQRRRRTAAARKSLDRSQTRPIAKRSSHATLYLRVRSKHRSASVCRRRRGPQTAGPVQALARNWSGPLRERSSLQTVPRYNRRGHQRSWLSALARQTKDGESWIKLAGSPDSTENSAASSEQFSSP